MTTATVTSKGQVTIPAPVRAALGLESGSRIEFVQTEKGKYLIVPATSSVHNLKGMLRKPVKPVSIEDMNQAIATQGAKAR
ncbi:MAG: AbrB/MazE/SpoVT family DNA-binding domain-containing protein [Glaciimonas sp.]|nr:AbrB/MazE/SpoVT family DNA-binding domain-containing protein [Glaciimonas sp.]